MQNRSNIISESVFSAVGFGVNNNFNALKLNTSGIKLFNNTYAETALPLGKCDEGIFKELEQNVLNPEKYTRFEKLLISSINDALSNISIQPDSEDTVIIISTTKGNIDLIHDSKQQDKLPLWYSAMQVEKYFKTANKPIVISNACISGVLALIYAHRLLSDKVFKHAIVVGADIMSDFVISGFNSFKSLSPGICKPFDAGRDGLSIGEGVGTIVLSSEINSDYAITGGASANDANHISGPSRTGEGLYQAIMHTINKSDNFDFISAHGTATPYNDDMESIAITRAGLKNVPVNSFKAYIGHTLGAAGIIETIFTLASMKNDLLIKSLGCDNPGVVENVNIIQNNTSSKINKSLKLASGFGGCNSAMIIEKNQ